MNFNIWVKSKFLCSWISPHSIAIFKALNAFPHNLNDRMRIMKYHSTFLVIGAVIAGLVIGMIIAYLLA